MYNEVFKKCGLVKADKYVVYEYMDGGYENVKEVWLDEVAQIKELYAGFEKLPAELAEQLKALEARLNK